jgi:hypothetical protein
MAIIVGVTFSGWAKSDDYEHGFCSRTTGSWTPARWVFAPAAP